MRFLPAGLCFFVAAALVFFWNLRLRRLIKQKTISLKESEKRLDQALDQANLGSWDCNLLTGEAINNKHYSLMLGYSQGEADFSYSGWLNQVHPGDRGLLEEYMKEFLNSADDRFEFEYRMRTKTGEWVWIHSCGGIAERDENGKPLRMTGIHQDISGRKLSEYLARKAVDDWENTFDSLPELIAVLDAEGTIIRVNKTQALALGMTREECIGRKLCTLMFPDDLSRKSCIPDFISGKIKPLTLQEVYIEKLQRYYEVSMSVLVDPDDGSIRVMHVARDISERKAAGKQQREMESRVQHTQKLESLGVLAGGIAHDFNNILMAIRGYTDLATSAVKEGEQVFEYLKEINKSVGVASELSGQMLAYSGRGNFVVETVYINDIIKKMRPMVQVSVSRKAELRINTNEDLPPVKVDSTQMEQVILNLLTNASEAIGSSRGTITLTTGFEKILPPGRTNSGKTKQPYVFIKVDDTGCGMSPEVLEKLFEPFYTTKVTGRGLGMAVVHGIVEGHKGFVTVSSEQGVGSSFKIFIPAVDKADKQMFSETEIKPSLSNVIPTGVLLVDDEANIVFIGRHVLQKYKYTVFSATNGEEALQVYRKNKELIQCVILDLTMPVMDGVECLRELKKIDPTVRVILSSGYNRQDAESKIHLDDIAGYLKKPYGLRALLAAVRRVLAGQ
ncbi:MAG: PAS domain-containing protein [Candidatus Sabulitectum sp.]|nr:PAS domain-containing protein [Candidatus Sabulitectum sp.]